MALYPDEICELLGCCEAYTRNEVDLEAMKSRIWKASRVVVALEEKELRQLLMRSEGELDSIQFTTDDDKIFERTLDVVRPLIVALKANLASRAQPPPTPDSPPSTPRG
jgi:hypothetical protein